MILDCDWSISVQLIPNNTKFCNKPLSSANRNSHQNISFSALRNSSIKTIGN